MDSSSEILSRRVVTPGRQCQPQCVYRLLANADQKFFWIRTVIFKLEGQLGRWYQLWWWSGSLYFKCHFCLAYASFSFVSVNFCDADTMNYLTSLGSDLDGVSDVSDVLSLRIYHLSKDMSDADLVRTSHMWKCGKSIVTRLSRVREVVKVWQLIALQQLFIHAWIGCNNTLAKLRAVTGASPGKCEIQEHFKTVLRFFRTAHRQNKSKLRHSNFMAIIHRWKI